MLIGISLWLKYRKYKYDSYIFLFIEKICQKNKDKPDYK